MVDNRSRGGGGGEGEEVGGVGVGEREVGVAGILPAVRSFSKATSKALWMASTSFILATSPAGKEVHVYVNVASSPPSPPIGYTPT